MPKKEFIYFLLILLVLLIFGLVATIEATTIDFESLDLIEDGECVWGEIPEMKFSLYYCKEENISYCKQ